MEHKVVGKFSCWSVCQIRFDKRNENLCLFRQSHCLEPVQSHSLPIPFLFTLCHQILPTGHHLSLWWIFLHLISSYPEVTEFQSSLCPIPVSNLAFALPFPWFRLCSISLLPAPKGHVSFSASSALWYLSLSSGLHQQNHRGSPTKCRSLFVLRVHHVHTPS